MQTGKLKRKVLIQRRADGDGPAGQPLNTWVNLITAGDGKVWADIRHLSGLETIKGGAEAAVTKVSIRIRYRTDVTSDMRVVHGSTTYQIKAVLPDAGGHQFLDLACEIVQ